VAARAQGAVDHDGALRRAGALQGAGEQVEAALQENGGVRRGGGRASAASLKAIFEVLDAGKVIGIFPEGTRSPDGRLYKGKTGMARMVLASGAPVLPFACEISQSDEAALKYAAVYPLTTFMRIMVGQVLIVLLFRAAA